jgi:hypothetical protein
MAMYLVDLKIFTFQDGCCWLVAPITLLHNNILKTPITEKDRDNITKFVTSEYGMPLSNIGSSSKK